MKPHRFEFSIALMARVLRVSRCAFYTWCSKRGPGKTAAARALRDTLVAEVFRAHKERYGSPRITEDLAEQGHPYDEKTVAASMRRKGLVARAGRKFKATTNSNHNLPVAPNLLKQDFHAQRPNEKWVQDITYLATDEGWLYLATVVDLSSRQVVGWAMSDRMKATLVCDALAMALFRRGCPRRVIVHSDRGSQYCSNQYQNLVGKHGLLCSMSKRGDCYNNACAESFFHSLKVELTHGERYATRAILRQEIFRYIETYFDPVRRHSALGYISPAAYELQYVA